MEREDVGNGWGSYVPDSNIAKRFFELQGLFPKEPTITKDNIKHDISYFEGKFTGNLTTEFPKYFKFEYNNSVYDVELGLISNKYSKNNERITKEEYNIARQNYINFKTDNGTYKRDDYTNKEYTQQAETNLKIAI